jgi:UDP-glucose 4-epimerase
MYLVTGGAGFIGSHLVRSLLQGGHPVRVFDNFSTGSRQNLPTSAPNLQIQVGDLRDPAQVHAAVQGVDFIFHLAAFTSVPQSIAEPLACFAINVQGTANLLEAARQASVQRVVLASSAAVYGDTPALPLTEESPLAFLSPYAASKHINEITAQLYTRVYGLPVISLRYFNVYGPRQSPLSPYAAVIPIWVKRMLAGQVPLVYGDGGQSRDFVFMRDVVQANRLAMHADTAQPGVYNICSGQSVSLLQLLEVLAELIPHAPTPEFHSPRPGDIYTSRGDPSRAAQVLGFTAQTPLLDGLAQTVAWMRP